MKLILWGRNGEASYIINPVIKSIQISLCSNIIWSLYLCVHITWICKDFLDMNYPSTNLTLRNWLNWGIVLADNGTIIAIKLQSTWRNFICFFITDKGFWVRWSSVNPSKSTMTTRPAMKNCSSNPPMVSMTMKDTFSTSSALWMNGLAQPDRIMTTLRPSWSYSGNGSCGLSLKMNSYKWQQLIRNL